MSEEAAEIGKFGRYVVVDQVGEGAMAKVYRAHDPEIDRYVAIKVLKDELCVDREYVDRFLREAKAAGTINHPNIVTIFDVGRVEEKPYITMEFLDEQTLEDVLDDSGKMPLKRLLRIGIQLANALDYAHKQGVVHRDIKPANILFMQDSDTIKVADFGIARVSKSEEVQKTQAGTVVGTPRYMSPEQAMGNPLDGRSDLFSLGVILYEISTGKKAFDSGTMTTLLLQITQEDPEPIKKVAPDLPVGLQRIVSRLLHKKPEKRFQTGAELAAALQRELDSLLDRELAAQQDKFIPLKIKWAAGAGLAVGAVLLISMLAVFYQQSKAIEAQVLDSGASLARFIATDSAVPVLSQDWSVLEIDVKNASERDTFEYLTITDNGGVIRAATDQNLIGHQYTSPATQELIREGSDFTAYMVEEDGTQPVFKFDTPVLFMYQGEPREIGMVHLALSREGLDTVMSTTRWLMVALGFVTILSVVGMLYVFGGLLARPFRRLQDSMRVLGSGDFDHRISDERNDEIGILFRGFNQMAEDLQQATADDQEDDAPAAPLPNMPDLSDFDDDDDATIVITTHSPGLGDEPVEDDATIVINRPTGD